MIDCAVLSVSTSDGGAVPWRWRLCRTAHTQARRSLLARFTIVRLLKPFVRYPRSVCAMRRRRRKSANRRRVAPRLVANVLVRNIANTHALSTLYLMCACVDGSGAARNACGATPVC
jgi:hypothetical protein